MYCAACVFCMRWRFCFQGKARGWALNACTVVPTYTMEYLAIHLLMLEPTASEPFRSGGRSDFDLGSMPEANSYGSYEVMVGRLLVMIWPPSARLAAWLAEEPHYSQIQALRSWFRRHRLFP